MCRVDVLRRQPNEPTRCWFYFGRAIEMGNPFLCAPDPDPVLASFQSTPTLHAYQYGRFELYVSAAGNESLWFAKREQYYYAMVANFYTCGITVQSLNSSTVRWCLLFLRTVSERGLHSWCVGATVERS